MPGDDPHPDPPGGPPSDAPPADSAPGAGATATLEPPPAANPLSDVVHEYVHLYPAQAAEEFEALPVPEAAALLASLTPADAAAVATLAEPGVAAQAVAALDTPAAAGILRRLDATHLAALLPRLTAEQRDARLADLPESLANEARELMTYPPNTAGQIMDPRVVSFRDHLTVGQVLERLHTIRRRRVRDLLLVDDDRRLVGAVPLPDAIMAEPEATLASLVRSPPPSINAMAPQDEVVETLTKSRLSGLPVVDIHGKLVGLIRQDALMQAIAEEATAGLQTMVGVSREERALSSPWMAVRKRLPWLNINLATAFLAAAVVGVFENTIAQVTALAVLLPVVAGQSGNTGAQALAVTMRGLALREMRVRQWLRVTVKEGVAGALNGLAVAVVTMVGVYLWSRSIPLCAVIGIAMVISMAIAAISGTLIPIVLTVMRQDPASSSSIILTTVTDIVGFFSFLGLATLFMKFLIEPGAG